MSDVYRLPIGSGQVTVNIGSRRAFDWRVDPTDGWFLEVRAALTQTGPRIRIEVKRTAPVGEAVIAQADIEDAEAAIYLGHALLHAGHWAQSVAAGQEGSHGA